MTYNLSYLHFRNLESQLHFWHPLNHFLTNLIKQLIELSNIIQVTLLFPGHWSHMALVSLQGNTVKTGSYLNSYSRLKDFSSARLTAVEWVDWMKSWQSCWWLLSLEVKFIAEIIQMMHVQLVHSFFLNVSVTGQIWFQVNFYQFPLFPSPIMNN